MTDRGSTYDSKRRFEATPEPPSASDRWRRWRARSSGGRSRADLRHPAALRHSSSPRLSVGDESPRRRTGLGFVGSAEGPSPAPRESRHCRFGPKTTRSTTGASAVQFPAATTEPARSGSSMREPTRSSSVTVRRSPSSCKASVSRGNTTWSRPHSRTAKSNGWRSCRVTGGRPHRHNHRSTPCWRR